MSDSEKVKQGQMWKDDYGFARVMVVAEGWAMMRRMNCNPFLVSVKILCADWELQVAGTQDNGG